MVHSVEGRVLGERLKEADKFVARTGNPEDVVLVVNLSSKVDVYMRGMVRCLGDRDKSVW